MSSYPDFTTMPIAGRWRAGRAGKTASDSNPWSGETLMQIPLAGAGDVDEAFGAAAAAQREWARRPPADRAAVMLAAAAVLESRKDEITGWLVREGGGTIAKADLEWNLVRAMMLEAASMPHHVTGAIMPTDVPGKESRVYREPAGVVAVISPWNFPLQLSNRSVAPALACGNAVVLKPANETEYGLSSAVFTGDLDRGTRFALRTKAGMTHVNDSPVNDDANTAFGGVKASGIGRFGGQWAMSEFTTEHWISVQRVPRAFPL